MSGYRILANGTPVEFLLCGSMLEGVCRKRVALCVLALASAGCGGLPDAAIATLFGSPMVESHYVRVDGGAPDGGEMSAGTGGSGGADATGGAIDAGADAAVDATGGALGSGGSGGASGVGGAVTVDASTDASACAHDPCSAGAALDPMCDPCVASVCVGSPTCCSAAWSIGCAQSVDTTCGDAGYFGVCGKGGMCEHPLCETGVPLVPVCDLCVYVICQKSPECCSSGWSQTCADAVTLDCGLTCP